MMSKEDDSMGESILVSVRLWVKTRVICQWRYLPNYRIVLLWTIKIFFQLFLSNRILLTLWGFCMIYFCHFLFPASHSISFQTHLLHTTSTILKQILVFWLLQAFSFPLRYFLSLWCRGCVANRLTEGGHAWSVEHPQSFSLICIPVYELSAQLHIYSHLQEMSTFSQVVSVLAPLSSLFDQPVF